ncbi:MAG: Asp/Glu racemase [Pseudomonadota bacterium]
MTTFTYDLAPDRRPSFGLIVLQADLTVEDDMRHLLPKQANLMVSRVPSGEEVTSETLQRMENHITGAAGLFPRGHRFDVVGYACTSGTAQIGAARVAELVRQGTVADHVTDPLTALVAMCHDHGVTRLAMLSPYIAPVSAKLRERLTDAGIATPVFGTFAEAEEAKVARISAGSIVDAAHKLLDGASVDALFLSCTNLKTLGVLARLEAELGVPVWSSNGCLAWHMQKLIK